MPDVAVTPMDNRQKLDLVVRMQRRARIRRILALALLLLLGGVVLVYAQYRHMVP